MNALNFLNLFLGILVVLLGISLGSFGTVLYSRFMRNNSIIFPHRSYCDSCKVRLTWREIIPIFSFLSQKGRCFHCCQAISRIYLKIEVLTLLLFVSSYVFEQRPPYILMLTVFAVISPVVIFIDLEIRRVPNKITLTFFVLLTILTLIFTNFDTSIGQQFQPLFVGLCISLFYFALVFSSKGGMGMGDAKLALPLGYLVTYFSWQQAVVSVILAFFIGAVYGAAQILFNGKGRKYAIPFAPFMILGAWLAILGGISLSASILKFWKIQ